MIRNDDYFEIIKEQNKELAKFRPFKSAYEMKKEIERLNNIIKQIYEIFKEGRFEDDCDCIQIEELITRELKGSDKE